MTTPGLRAAGLDVAAAREWLRDHLPEGEPVELSDEATLDRAVAVLTRGRAKEERRKEEAA